MLETTFLFAAVIGGVFFIIQVLMMFVGGDGDDFGDVDVDTGFDAESGDVDGHTSSGSSMFYEMFSLRTIAAAVTFFGLVGMAVRKSGGSEIQATVFAVLAGGGALYGVFWIYKQIFKLQSSGNQDIRNSVGLPAKVYVPIAPKRSGQGKIQLTMQGRIVEFLAVTDDEERLSTSENVYVLDIVDGSTLLVSRTIESAV